MNKNAISIGLTSIWIVLFSIASLPNTILGSQTSVSDRLFDSYGNLSWENEKAHLDNFAIALEQERDLVGIIIVYAGRRSCANEARDRAVRAKNYVAQTRGIEPNRIKWIDGGYRETVTVILQPMPSGAPELTASPTLKPSEVRVDKTCKLKTIKSKKDRF
jgi:hypothetical protein